MSKDPVPVFYDLQKTVSVLARETAYPFRVNTAVEVAKADMGDVAQA